MTEILLLLIAGVTVIWSWLHHVLSRTLREGPFLHRDDEVRLPDPAPLVSVLIAAHNEAGNIGRTVEGILAQDYPNFEVLVVDDRSEDETSDVVREYARKDARLRLFRCTELPDGWTGKNHAFWQTVRYARGEILLFMDADVALDPGALSVMVTCLIERRADTLSLVLRLDSKNFWEQAVHLFIGPLIMGRFPLHEVNDPDCRRAFANGQVNMMRAETYRAIGGHKRVKSIVLEDMAFARLVKQEGYRPHFAYGFDMGSVRWYPTLRAIWHGWSRVFYYVFQGSLLEMSRAAGMVTFGALIPSCVLIYTAVRLLAGTADTSITALFLLSAFELAVMTWLFARLAVMSRCQRRYAAMIVPSAAITLGIIGSCIIRRLTGGKIVWKGRHYQVLFEPPGPDDETESPPTLVEEEVLRPRKTCETASRGAQYVEETEP